MFTVSIKTLQGVVISAPSTRQDDTKIPEKLDGTGWVDLRLDHFPLLPGTYDISASVMDYTLAHPYDVRRNVLRINVDRKGQMDPEGIVSLGGEWSYGS